MGSKYSSDGRDKKHKRFSRESGYLEDGVNRTVDFSIDCVETSCSIAKELV
jgi:hypothetical protein